MFSAGRRRETYAAAVGSDALGSSLGYSLGCREEDDESTRFAFGVFHGEYVFDKATRVYHL